MAASDGRRVSQSFEDVVDPIMYMPIEPGSGLTAPPSVSGAGPSPHDRERVKPPRVNHHRLSP